MNNTTTFPQFISLTLTNSCNLRCKMCGQWSENGYMHNKKNNLKNELNLEEWKRIIDELAVHNIKSLLLRGGETFLFPGIIELLEYIVSKNIHVSIDTNGTLIKKYAQDIVRTGNIHLTISIDGPQEIHDSVRNVKGTFAKIKEGLILLNKIDPGQKISRSINFTISPYSYKGLGQTANIARSLKIKTITIVPYYWYTDKTGEQYKKELSSLGCKGNSWQGFHHEDSGIDIDDFIKQYREFINSLGDIYLYPYMPITGEKEYIEWFSHCDTQVGPAACNNIEALIDIQPEGNVNFCVDIIDYTIGNVRENSIEQIWNNEKAERFRTARRKKPLAVCYRCGAKYMSVLHE